MQTFYLILHIFKGISILVAGVWTIPMLINFIYGDPVPVEDFTSTAAPMSGILPMLLIFTCVLIAIREFHKAAGIIQKRKDE